VLFNHVVQICAGTLVDIASSVSGLKSRSAELLSSHKQIMANRLDERRVSIPARVLHDKVVASIRDGLCCFQCSL